MILFPQTSFPLINSKYIHHESTQVHKSINIAINFTTSDWISTHCETKMTGSDHINLCQADMKVKIPLQSPKDF